MRPTTLMASAALPVTSLGTLVDPLGVECSIDVFIGGGLVFYSTDIMEFVDLEDYFADKSFQCASVVANGETITTLTIDTVYNIVDQANHDGVFAENVGLLGKLDNLARAQIVQVPRIEEIINKISLLSTFQAVEYEVAMYNAHNGIYLLDLGRNAAVYAAVDNLGSAILSKIREYRKLGINVTILGVWKCASFDAAQRGSKRIDMFVEQHCIGFVCAEGRFINTNDWARKSEIINQLITAQEC